MADVLPGDECLIRRKFFTLLGASFHVFDTQGNLILFSRQKAFKLKEDIRVYSDESMREERLLIKARQIIDFSAAYDVVDPSEGRSVGALRRKGFRSIFRDSWEVLDSSDRPTGAIQEDSGLLSFVRRFLSNLVPQTFHLSTDGRQVATFKQHFNPFILKLQVRLEPGAKDVVDPRLVVAAGILLAAVEGRQD